MPHIAGLRVIKSSIHGYGVVATRDFREGEPIADVEGVPLRPDQIENDDYCLWINDDMYFDMVDQTRWINHSCDPNAEIEGEEDPDGRVWARVLAARDIKAGEEITYDYGFALVHAMPCRCSTPRCRGWIIDPDELPALRAKLAAQNGAAGANGTNGTANGASAGANGASA
jgi:hypothetical protein